MADKYLTQEEIEGLYPPGAPNSGGNHDQAQYAFQGFQRFFGRGPTQAELAQVIPTYRGGDKNRPDVTSGDAMVAQLASLNKQTDPTAQKEDAAKYADDVKGAFTSVLGRDATQQELDHFGAMISNGTADSYSIGQALQTLPEYTTKADQSARENLRGELTTADTKYYKDNIIPTIQSQFAQQGRDVSAGSAGLQAALANAAKETNNQRETYLATVGREDYTNRRSDTVNQYLQGLQRQYQVADTTGQRKNDLADYYMQKSAYDQYLQNYGKRKSGGGSMFGGIAGGAMSGAATGATVGGPWGALIGGVAGAGLGAYGASQQRGIY